MHSIARGYIDFSFVIKESLSRLPYFKHIMSSLDAIAVGRTNPKEDLKKVLTEGKRILTEGRSIVIFPQHTRTEDFIPENFNTIGIKLAKSAGVPVVPLALKTDFTKNGRIIRDMGAICPEHEVWYEFGPAVEIEGNGHEQHRKIVEFIKSRVDSWKAAEGR
jgi:1-acyl-sn-glycerol-3-phosphate acyltransferase